MNYEDIKAKFPGASAVGGEIIARVGHEAVVVATYSNGSFSLTKNGEDAPAVEVKPTKADKKAAKGAKVKAAEVPEAPKEPEVVTPEAPAPDTTLDDILNS